MDKEKESRKKLIESAKKEFIENGYMKASLRNICRNAGLTTGALYFFFKDKEELFESVVSEPLAALDKIIKTHFAEEVSDIEMIGADDMEDDYSAAIDILTVLFGYKEEILLIINKSQGTKFEGFVDRYVEFIYKHYLGLYWKQKGYGSAEELTKEDRFIVHWMSHDQIDIFIHMLTHCNNIEEAERQMRGLFNYMVGGWFAAIKNSII